MIDNDIQSCLTYDIEIIFSNRLYNCIIELKDIFVIFCVTVYNKICIKKVICGERVWFICHLEILRSLSDMEGFLPSNLINNQYQGN
jgi:hypothetical protein